MALGLVLVVVTTACAGPRPAAPIPAPADCGPDLPGLTRTTIAVGGGVVLHVALGGPLGAPPVVLLHGFPETWRTWRGVVGELLPDHRVVVPDLRGAGCSSFAPPGTDAYDKRSLASDLARLSEVLGLRPALVVGHDMGAMTAFAWARTRPDQVAGLVLSGGGIPGHGLAELGPPHLTTFAAPPGVVAAGIGDDLPGFLARFVGDPAFAASGSLDDVVRAYSRPGRLDAALGQYRALARDAAVEGPDASPLPMPVTTVEGEAAGVPGISTRTVRALAPRLREITVPGAGHFVQEDQPAATATAIRVARRDR